MLEQHYSDPDVIGKTITLNKFSKKTCTIVGVMPMVLISLSTQAEQSPICDQHEHSSDPVWGNNSGR